MIRVESFSGFRSPPEALETGAIAIKIDSDIELIKRGVDRLDRVPASKQVK
jgi:hypothetical protein